MTNPSKHSSMKPEFINLAYMPRVPNNEEYYKGESSSGWAL